VTFSFPAVDSLGRPWQQVAWDFERGPTSQDPFVADATGATVMHLYPSPSGKSGNPYRTQFSVQATDADGHVVEQSEGVACYLPIGILRVSPASGTFSLPLILTIESTYPVFEVDAITPNGNESLSKPIALSPDMPGLFRYRDTVSPGGLGPFDVAIVNQGYDYARYHYAGTAGKPFGFHFEKLRLQGSVGRLTHIVAWLDYVSYARGSTRATVTAVFERCRRRPGPGPKHAISCGRRSRVWQPVPGRSAGKKVGRNEQGGRQAVALFFAASTRALRQSAGQGYRLRLRATARVVTKRGALLFTRTIKRDFACHSGHERKWC
jgi:hypothetical protein